MAMKSFAKILLISVALQMQQAIPAQEAIGTSELVQANNAFAVELYSCLAKQPGNFVCSPFSIDTALTMASAGARGTTARQMAKVLYDSNTNADLHAEFGDFLDRLKGINTSDTQFLVANSLWVQRGYPFLKPFQELLHNNYQAGLMQIDLTGWPAEFNPTVAAAARKQINDWAANQTGGKINEFLPRTLPAQNTRLILLDAVYFKGLWAAHFETRLTTNSVFQIRTRESVSVPTMHIRGDFPYYYDEDFQALQLPYVSNRLSMLILLPKKNDGLSELEESITVPRIEHVSLTGDSQQKTIAVSRIEQVCQLISMRTVDVSLPRFTETSEFNLEEPLKAMGMIDAFQEDNADFSGITTGKPFFMEAAIHEARLSVDEQGTEAAAVAGLSFADDDKSSPPPAFVADHPFLYLVRDNVTGTILFMGRVVDPSKK
jgi:serpin B